MAVLLAERAPAPSDEVATRRATVLLSGSHRELAELTDELSADRFAVCRSRDAEATLAAVAEGAPDVVVIDARTGHAAAIDLLLRLREGDPSRAWDRSLPVLVLCPGGEPHAPIRALERGADDAMCDPLAYPELAVRIAALLRRVRGGSFAELRVGPLVICAEERQASLHGRHLALCGKEFALLAALAREPRRVLSKDELMLRVWGYRTAVRTRTVDTHASRLRRKLALVDPRLGLVANVWGVGYRLLPLDA